MIRQLENRAVENLQIRAGGQEFRNIPSFTPLKEDVQAPLPLRCLHNIVQRNGTVSSAPLGPGEIPGNSEEVALPGSPLRIKLPDSPGAHRIENHDEYFLRKFFSSGN